MSRLLEKYTGRTGDDGGLSDRLGEAEAAEDLASFGWLRGIRDRAIMLQLRKKDGNVLAVGYAWLERAEFDPSVGITLHVAGRQRIRIKGRNLNAEARPNVRLFDGIARHRVPWIQEAARSADMQAGDSETVIEAIEW